MKVDNTLGELVSTETLFDSLIAKESDQEAIVSSKFKIVFIVTLCIYDICITKYINKLHPVPWTYKSLYTFVTSCMHDFKFEL